MEVVDAAGEGCVFVGGLEVIQHRHAAVLAADDQRVREDGSVGAFDPLKNLDRKLNACVGWHEEKGTACEMSLVECGVFAGAEFHGLRHEVFFEEVGVLGGGGLECLKNDALRQGRLAVEESIVAKDKLRRCLGESGGGVDEAAFAGDGLGFDERGEVEGLEVGEPPGFVLAGRGGGVLVFRQGG